jgi:hypothetical protein
MGGAYIALAEDATAVHWNPAGLTQLNRPEATFAQNFWLMDMSYQYAAVVIPRKIGRFGIAFAYSSSGDLPKFEDFEKTGEYSAHDMSATFSYARRFSDGLSTGLSLKLIQQKIEEESATGFALDLGLLYRFLSVPGMRLGLAVSNVGPAIKFIAEADPLPLKVSAGGTYVWGPLTLAMDISKPTEDDVRIGVGSEIRVRSVLALRTGYDSASTYTAGAGLMWRNLSFGYAFVPYEDLDDSHRVSAGLRF